MGALVASCAWGVRCADVHLASWEVGRLGGPVQTGRRPRGQRKRPVIVYKGLNMFIMLLAWPVAMGAPGVASLQPSCRMLPPTCWKGVTFLRAAA